MKTILIRRILLSGVASATLLLGTTVIASEKGNQHRRAELEPGNAGKPRVILVHVTGSRIPQRVVLNGTQVNSASPLTIMGRHDLSRSGASTVEGILARDPSISFRRR
jgi:outer membrane cobalamin receptor